MKQGVTTKGLKYTFHQLLIRAALVLLLAPVQLSAQADSIAAGTPSTQEEPSLIAPSLEFVSIQKNNSTVDLVAGLKAKFKNSFIKLPLLKVSFVQVSDTAEKTLGFAISNREGVATLNIKADQLEPGPDGAVHIKAVFAGNKSMEAADGEVTFKKARLEITPVVEDSLYTVRIKLVDLSTGAEVPVPEIAVGIFVNRSFKALKLGEGTTDENGEVIVEIPNSLPGDANGNITLLTKLDENEFFGNIEAATTAKWGIPVSDKLKKLPRALWSSHPPIWMLVTFIILMTAVWGHYIVIVYELFRLRKEEPHTPDNATIS